MQPNKSLALAAYFMAVVGCSNGASNPAPDLGAGDDFSVAPGDLADARDATLAAADLSSRPDLASGPDLAAPPDLARPATLELSLDITLDDPGDTIKAVTINSAELLDTTGTTVATAKIDAGIAAFDLSSLVGGDYFIKVNGDSDNLVPTRIDDPAAAISQRVGATLRPSLIGPIGAPMYRVRTYPASQGQSPVVRFSDGTPVMGEQPYVLITLGIPKFDFKLLGSATTFNSVVPQTMHAAQNPFDSWLLNTANQLHHGDVFNDMPATCSNCHWRMDQKPPMSTSVEPFLGWCYRCHDGTTGSDSGFVDPNR